MIIEVDDPNREFVDYWHWNHPHGLDSLGFDGNSQLHHSIVAKDDADTVVGAALFIPFIENGVVLGHHAHLTCFYRCKMLIRFCREVMRVAMQLPDVGLLCVETHGDPERKPVERLIQFLGFQAIRTDEGWDDFLWNSKVA